LPAEQSFATSLALLNCPQQKNTLAAFNMQQQRIQTRARSGRTSAPRVSVAPKALFGRSKAAVVDKPKKTVSKTTSSKTTKQAPKE
jgi:hypothetical protein